MSHWGCGLTPKCPTGPLVKTNSQSASTACRNSVSRTQRAVRQLPDSGEGLSWRLRRLKRRLRGAEDPELEAAGFSVLESIVAGEAP